jgi:hypothetical protein
VPAEFSFRYAKDGYQANGVWRASYAGLNPGMQRMNVGNRLRAAVKKGHGIVQFERTPKRIRRRAS